MSTLTKALARKIADWLEDHYLTSEIGDESAAGGVAAINLALTGELTDKIPDCMSQVIRQWIIRMQDAMPEDLRNSAGWKRLLPLAAGTGRELERNRLKIIMEWMWTTVLPQLQSIAKKEGFEKSWAKMCHERTPMAAYAAYAAAKAAKAAKAVDAAYAAYAAADYAADAAYATAYATAYVTYATYATDAVAVAVAAAADAARAAVHAAADAADDMGLSFWFAINPCALLASLIDCGE